MGTRLTSLLAAFALAAVFNAAITRDQAWAVVCANDPGSPNNGTAYVVPATDGGVAENTACGNGADASGAGGFNSAIGNSTFASGDGARTPRSATTPMLAA